jgi:hypothetical protein
VKKGGDVLSGFNSSSNSWRWTTIHHPESLQNKRKAFQSSSDAQYEHLAAAEIFSLV